MHCPAGYHAIGSGRKEGDEAPSPSSPPAPVLSLEPALILLAHDLDVTLDAQVFQGLENLEREHKTTLPRFAYPTSDAAFDAACSALKALL